MALPISYMWQMIRDANRRHYEAEIAAGKRERLKPELEALLHGFQNDMTLTLAGRIPLDEINAKADECAKEAGITREEFKEMFLEHKRKELDVRVETEKADAPQHQDPRP